MTRQGKVGKLERRAGLGCHVQTSAVLEAAAGRPCVEHGRQGCVALRRTRHPFPRHPSPLFALLIPLHVTPPPKIQLEEWTCPLSDPQRAILEAAAAVLATLLRDLARTQRLDM